ncbi:MAG: hypothetical protein HZC38_18285 [Chloroflexi bacterium]|nr:hypothetical protein [Chloroflexota bacterium]
MTSGARMGNVTRAEWRWAIIASFLIIALSSIPSLTGYLAQTPDKIFGGAVFDRMDYNVHLASILTGLRGEWAYPILHTHESIPPSYVKLFYIFIGQFGRIVPLSPYTLYEIARVACGVWMSLTMYAFASRFLFSIALRRTAFLFFSLGSGLGWVMLALKWLPDSNVSPIDFWLMDLYGFFSLLTFPHFTTVFALTWSGALAFLNFQRDGKPRDMIFSIITALLILYFQPFAVGILDSVLSLYAISRWMWRRKIIWREFVGLSFMAISQVPLLMYSAFTFWGDATWRSSSGQLIMLSPSPIYYVMGIGLVGALAFFGAWRLIRHAPDESWLLMIWMVAVAVLIYLPTQFQRRFTEGAWAPLSVLAAMGVATLMPRLRRLKGVAARVRYPYPRARGLIIMLIILIASASSLYLTFGGALIALTRNATLFDSADMMNAISWLQTNSQWQETIFTSEKTGNVIPARIGHRVYLGHPVETANYTVKVENANRFFSTMSDEERKTLLAQCGCRFVFYSPHERELGSFNFDSVNYLKRVYHNDEVAIYEVTR